MGQLISWLDKEVARPSGSQLDCLLARFFFSTSKMYPLGPTHFTGLAGWAE